MSKPTAFLTKLLPMRPVPITATVLPVTSSPSQGWYGCHVDQVCSRTICSEGQVLRATAPMIRKANSAVASVSTSAVWLNGILCSLAAARSMLSKPTASWATIFRPAALPAANTSRSMGSRRVVISASMPLRTFSRIRLFGRRLDVVVDLELPALVAQALQGLLADVGRGEDAEGHEGAV